MTTPTPREAERRQLTVLFCDLVGSTELAARLDPEDMGQVIGAYQGGSATVVKRWGGHIARYLGDGVLAYFGWPRAHEDDAERAVRAGLELAARGRASEDVGNGATLAARVGIATGVVMVGELIGEGGAAQEQTVVGRDAEPGGPVAGARRAGQRVVSHGDAAAAWAACSSSADLGPQRLKGFAEPLAAWRVEGEGRAEGRFEALHGEHLTPLVGREHELGILLERWAWAKDGDGQVVLLSGEPGIGKSRLIRALRERLGDEPYTPLSHYCSPYHTNSALHPVIALLERAARLDREEPPEAKLAKLEAVLAESDREPRRGHAPARRPARRPDRRALSGARPDAGSAKAADLAGAGRSPRGPGGAAPGVGAVRGRALDRPLDARAPGPRDRARPAATCSGADHLPPGVHTRPGPASRTRPR